MREFERRLEALERSWQYGSRDGMGGGPKDPSAREFVVGTLAALGHVRRAPIDVGTPYGYTAAILGELPPFELAQYVTALTLLEHEDAGGARIMLAAKPAPLGGSEYLPLIEHVVGRLRAIAS